jgi:hypothetical protein
MIRKPVKIASIKIRVFFVSIQRENVIFAGCDVREIKGTVTVPAIEPASLFSTTSIPPLPPVTGNGEPSSSFPS